MKGKNNLPNNFKKEPPAFATAPTADAPVKNFNVLNNIGILATAAPALFNPFMIPLNGLNILRSAPINPPVLVIAPPGPTTFLP